SRVARQRSAVAAATLPLLRLPGGQAQPTGLADRGLPARRPGRPRVGRVRGLLLGTPAAAVRVPLRRPAPPGRRALPAPGHPVRRGPGGADAGRAGAAAGVGARGLAASGTIAGERLPTLPAV